MADVNYGQGVATERPQTEAPNDYQNITNKVGPALQDLGRTAVAVGDHYGQIAADDAFNNFQSGVTKILHGDGTTMGPDGQPVVGYLGLKGAAAMRAQRDVQQNIDDLLKQNTKGLFGDSLTSYQTAAQKYATSTTGQVATHAETEQSTWATSVNAASESNALTRIANNPTDLTTLANAAADVINARVKQAQVNGAVPGDPVYQEAVDTGKRLALTTQIQAIGAADPAKALSILIKNRKIAGTDYDQLYDKYENQAAEQTGTAFATQQFTAATQQHAEAQAASPTNPAQPVYRDTVSAIPGGLSPAGLARLVQVESGGNATVINASGHKGATQFSDATWKEYGNGGDPLNFNDSVAAAQRYAAANARFLTPLLGRPPTDAELYLAHQQGPGGARKLLTNPGASAASLIGLAAVVQNGGRADMTAAQFTSMWAHKFDGTTPADAPAEPLMGRGLGANGVTAPPVASSAEPVSPNAGVTGINTDASPNNPATVAAPDANPLPSEVMEQQSPKAAAMQAILDDTTLSPKAKDYAVAALNRQFAAQAIADDATAKARKDQEDAAANTHMTKILNGQLDGEAEAIANDPALDWNTKKSLSDALSAHAENSVSGASAAYGDGFWSAYKQVTAQIGDPSRIADVGQLLRRAGPGGDLTLAGVQKLQTMMTMNQKTVDGTAVNDAKKGIMTYAKSKLSFQQDTGPIQIKDPQGEALFNARFIPRFEAAYDTWVKDGKDPWEFLTQENVDKMIGGLRSPREMAMAQMLAQTTGLDTTQLAAPPAPAGVDQQGWIVVNNAVPLYQGKPLEPERWHGVIATLQQNPTPTARKWFDAHFADAGITADSVLDVLGVKPLDADPIAPPHVPDPRNAIINGVEDTGLPMPAAIPQ